jgi:hypothetical protein
MYRNCTKSRRTLLEDARSHRFEKDLDWALSLDGRASFAHTQLARKQLEWFERTAH